MDFNIVTSGGDIMTTEKPLYIELTKKLIDHITTECQAGDLLISERELIAKTKMSRTTVRLALKEVELLGYIKTIPGKGRFVTEYYQEIMNIGNMYSFTDEINKLGNVAKTIVINCNLTFASPLVAKNLGIRESDKVVFINRLRLSNQTPMMLEDTFLPYQLFEGLEKVDFSKVSLYETLRTQYQTIVSFAEEEVFANIANENEAALLQISENQPVLEIFRTTYSSKNNIIEYTHSVARGDKFSYKTTHTNKQRN